VAALARAWHERQTLRLTLLAAVATLLGATFFSWTQGVSWFTGLYWSVVTVTTVGYGDVTPHNTVGRIIAMATMLTALPLLAGAFGGWASALITLHLRRLWGMTIEAPKDHVVILGFTPLISQVLPDLLATAPAVVMVSSTPPSDLPEGVRCLTGDPTNPHVLAKAHLATARHVVVVGDTDGDVLMTAVEVRHLVPTAPLYALTHSRHAANALKDLGIVHATAAQDVLGQVLVTSWETPHAADLVSALLAASDTHLREEPVPAEWVGRSLATVRGQWPGLLLGLVRADGSVELGVGDEVTVAADDRLVWVSADHA